MNADLHFLLWACLLALAWWMFREKPQAPRRMSGQERVAHYRCLDCFCMMTLDEHGRCEKCGSGVVEELIYR